MNAPRPELIIEAGRAEQQYWHDLWHFRELFYILAWRDIVVRYKQTVIGVAWAVIRPFLTIVVFTLVFNRVAKLEAPNGIPYALFVSAALIPWQFFASAFSEASGSLLSNSSLISKVYFPRLIIPAGSVITSLVDFALTLGMLAVLMLWYGFAPDWRILFLPLFILQAFAAALGAGVFLCALNVKYRDFRYIIPFVVQFGLYISPVFYSTTAIQEKYGDVGRMIVAINPIVGVIDGYRWAICGTTPLHWQSFVTSILLSLIMLFVGVWYFRRMEKTFADVI